jgi:CBS domain-containing protein
VFEAQDVMSRDVICLRQDLTVEEAIDKLIQAGISGAPVVDDGGQLVGIVSEFTLLEIVYEPTLRQQPIASLMTRDVITAAETELLTELAHRMIAHRIRRLPVVRAGQVVGILTRKDLLHYVRENLESVTQFFDTIHQFTESEA